MIGKTASMSLKKKGELWMQKKDVLSVQYFEDAMRFVDLINGFLFGGKNVVKALQVRECNRIILKKQKCLGD